jgi:hypothetical protein
MAKIEMSLFGALFPFSESLFSAISAKKCQEIILATNNQYLRKE